jgi:hypothetical protein
MCGIRTHDRGFRASEDSACLRSLGYRDRHKFVNRRHRFKTILIFLKLLYVVSQGRKAEYVLWLTVRELQMGRNKIRNITYGDFES